MPIMPNQESEGKLKSTFLLILWLGGAALIVGLMVLAISGWFARYLQDDYCFDFLLKHKGFWNSQGFTYFNEVNKGGHFAAWEEPELFSAEVRAAFRSRR